MEGETGHSLADLARLDVPRRRGSGLSRSRVERLFRLLLLGTATGLACAANQSGFWDQRFFADGIHGTVKAIAVSGNDIYAGGLFTSADNVLTTNIARWNGTNWSALDSGVNGAVNAIAVRGGDLYVGGAFSTAGGVSASRVAKWDGTNWWPVGTGISGTTVNALAVSADGTLYAGGDFTAAGGVSATNIAKWDGTNWSALSLGVSGLDAACVLALAAKGRDLFVGGYFTDADGVSVNCVAKWDGTNFSALGNGVDDPNYPPIVSALTVSGTDLYVGGAFTLAGGVTVNHVAKWDGANWSALGGGLERFFGDVPVSALTVSGGKLVVGGRFNSAGGGAATNLAVWDGTSWSQFGGGASGQITSLGVQQAKVLVGGSFSAAGGSLPFALAQWTGQSWAAVSAGGGQGIVGQQNCVSTCQGDDVAALVADGTTVYAAGGFTLAGGISVANAARWDGTNWTPLGSGISGSINALALNGGDLFVGGKFTPPPGTTSSNIARWDGDHWSAVGGGINGAVYALVATGDVLYAAGAFTSAGGLSATNIARWNGSTWSALGAGINGPVYAIAIHGGDLYAGGRFTAVGGFNATNLARWNGSSWSGVSGGVGGTVNPIVRLRPPPISSLLANGSDLYVAGDFAWAGGVSITNIARWDGSNWTAVGEGVVNGLSFAPPPTIRAMVWNEGALFVGGSFTNAGGVSARNIAQWDGSRWSALGNGVTGFAAETSVFALAATPDGLAVGGHFQFAGGHPAADFTLWRSRPRLRITAAGGFIRLGWPAAWTGFGLEENADLATTNWARVATTPSDDGGEAQVTLPKLSGSRFYRLREP